MVKQLKRVLNSIEEEIKSEISIWDKEQLISVVKPEMEELYTHFKNGRVFFKYGKKQRMLESTYIITDSIRNLNNTSLGKEIIKLQEMYNKLKQKLLLQSKLGEFTFWQARFSFVQQKSKGKGKVLCGLAFYKAQNQSFARQKHCKIWYLIG